MISIKKYASICNEIILRSFPTLKNKNIEIYEEKDLPFSADTRKNILGQRRIRTHLRLRKYDRRKLIGLFAHELSHLEYFDTLNWFSYEFIRDFKRYSKKYLIKEEKDADISAIMKGYARELYSQRKSRWDSKDKEGKDKQWMYMSPEEIKKISIKLKKW